MGVIYIYIFFFFYKILLYVYVCCEGAEHKYFKIFILYISRLKTTGV